MELPQRDSARTNEVDSRKDRRMLGWHGKELAGPGSFVSQSCRVSGKPVLVRKSELVTVGWGGGDDVGAAIVGNVEPAHAGCGDDDSPCPVVGDEPQEP